MQEIIKGPRPHVYVDSNVVVKIRSVLFGTPLCRIDQGEAIAQLIDRHMQDWTLVAGDTVMKEVRADLNPKSAHLIEMGSEILDSLPLLRQSDGEVGGHYPLQVGDPYKEFRAFLAKLESHFADKPRDVKLLADAFHNAMDCIVSLDRPLKNGWDRVRTGYPQKVRELVGACGTVIGEVEVLSPMEFVTRYRAS